ncbi:MAG: hypothetical protein KAT66_07430 [Candidatus Lokiarchaeota archaeon]|nr:hypothetical protein [Candidatus Lokiarchaeota archaeon]
MSEINKEFRCPRCGSSSLINYGKTFECTNCHLEFYKELDEDIEDENRISLQEMKGFIDSFLPSDKKNKNKRT